jgi:hypothetical protein
MLLTLLFLDRGGLAPTVSGITLLTGLNGVCPFVTHSGFCKDWLILNHVPVGSYFHVRRPMQESLYGDFIVYIRIWHFTTYSLILFLHGFL